MVADDLPLLKSKGITHIVNCAADTCVNRFPQHFDYLTIHLLDSPDEDLLSVMYDIIHFIENSHSKGGRTLVHCQKGVSRSPAICIGYLMLVRNEGYPAMASFVKQHRTISRPNLNFSCQLIEWKRRTAGNDERKAYLYRIAPHSLRDTSRLVGKWIDKICNSALDCRGVFILYSVVHRKIFVYVGGACKDVEVYSKKANALIKDFQTYEHAPEDVEFVYASQVHAAQFKEMNLAHGKSLAKFWQIIGPATDGETGYLINPFNRQYDQDYGDPSLYSIFTDSIASDRGSRSNSPKKPSERGSRRSSLLNGVNSSSSNSNSSSSSHSSSSSSENMSEGSSHSNGGESTEPPRGRVRRRRSSTGNLAVVFQKLREEEN